MLAQNQTYGCGAALERKRANRSKALVTQEAGAKNSTLAFCTTTMDVYKKLLLRLPWKLGPGHRLITLVCSSAYFLSLAPKRLFPRRGLGNKNDL